MDMTDYVAHTPPETEPNKWQSMTDHTRNVADMAAAFARPFGAEELATWAGWLHDVGKYSPEFQKYLRDCAAGIPRKPGSAEHKCAGTKLAVESLPKGIRDIIAPCVLGHHGGLNALSELNSTLAEAALSQDLTVPILRAQQDFPDLRATPPAVIPGWDRAGATRDAKALHLEMLTRFVFSCLVDADGLDTEQHFDPSKAPLRRPFTLRDVEDRWAVALQQSQDDLQRDAPENHVNRVRREVYAACQAAATQAPGVFTLTVPTGGGKTRSSLAFALAHARAHGQARIIYAIPYTSIIDQTAAVFRDILSGDGVLEHHSAVEPRVAEAGETPAEAQAEAAREQQRRMASENWNAPLVVTTTVQFFESLFANRTSRCRKLHHIAGSVVILDEVQTLPAPLLAPLLHGLRALVEHYGVTVVLCTATQPALIGQTRYWDGLPQATPIISNPAPHFAALRRVTYRVALEPWDWARVATEVQSNPRSCLVVLNTKKDALAVLEALDDANARHLSTLLCGAHRRQVLAEVRAALVREREQGGPPVRLVSTQVIEAGVDVDFPRVLRAMGPLDRIIQAAGRCNREGWRDPTDSKVIVFTPSEGRIPPGEYQMAMRLAESLIAQNPAFDFDTPEVATEYFAKLYDLFGKQGLDQKKVQEARQSLNFPEVAKKVRLIEEDTLPVLVPYHQGHCPEADLTKDEFLALVENIRQMAAGQQASHRKGKTLSRKLWQDIQSLTVAVYTTELKNLPVSELVTEQLFLWGGTYDPVVGIGGSVQWDISDLYVGP